MSRRKAHSLPTVDRLSFAGMIIIALMGAAALTAPFLPYRPDAIDIGNYLMPPSSAHWMGTDLLGRDLLVRMAYGARISLTVGFVAVGISVSIGVLFGALAGYYGGLLDTLMMRLVDIMLTFPAIFLILALIAFLEPDIYIIMTVLGLTGWMGTARLVRAEVLSLREREFVLAARAGGVPDRTIILRHLVPNAMAPVLVNATLGVAGAILTETSLSFLGIGVQPPLPSWGNILTDSKSCLGVAWWMVFFPGAAIFLTVLAFNLLGEGLRIRLTHQRTS